ncbi:MAG: hypothetical protein ABJB40_02035 [Acidobacteriota bacterium]
MKINKKLISCVLLVASIASGCKMLSKMMGKGGTEFKVQIDSSEGDKATLVERAIKVTQNKIDALALNGEVTKDTTDPTAMIVRIYDAEDLERIKKFLFTAYQLELKKVISPPNPSPLQTFPTAEEAMKAVKSEQDVLPYTERTDQNEKFVIVEKNVIVTGDDIRDARAVSYSRSKESPEYQISFSLKPEGAAKFGEWTGKNIGNYIAVVLDKKVQSAAFIKSQIFDSGEISGRFTKAEAEDVAMSLKSGYLPATLRVIGEKPIGN